MPKFPFAVFILSICLIGAGCTEVTKAPPLSLQTKKSSSLDGANLLTQLPSNWQVRKASSDDALYFYPQDRAWLAGPSDWLAPTPDAPAEGRSVFVGCTITQIPLTTSTSIEEWFSKNPIYSEEDMWFLGSTSTFQTDHLGQGIAANEGTPNATRTISIYLKTSDQYITRVSFFDGADIDEAQREKLPEIAAGCRAIASSLQAE